MMALARAGEPEGSWLRAERQTGGRGRQGRVWESPPGNLYASTLVRVTKSDPNTATLALVVSLALYETVLPLLTRHSREGGSDGEVKLLLKWPNDLLLSGAKLSGILLEREQDAVVIGIGVNLAHHPEGLDRPATSLASAGSASTPAEFLNALAAQMAIWLARWRSEGLDVFREEWLKRAHPPGTLLSVHDASGDSAEGTFDGLTPEGSLQLRLADGSIRVIHAGDVFLI